MAIDGSLYFFNFFSNLHFQCSYDDSLYLARCRFFGCCLFWTAGLPWLLFSLIFSTWLNADESVSLFSLSFMKMIADRYLSKIKKKCKIIPSQMLFFGTLVGLLSSDILYGASWCIKSANVWLWKKMAVVVAADEMCRLFFGVWFVLMLFSNCIAYAIGWFVGYVLSVADNTGKWYR